MTWGEFKKSMEEEVGVKDGHYVEFELRPNILKPDIVSGLLTIDTAKECVETGGEFFPVVWIDKNLPPNHININGKVIKVEDIQAEYSKSNPCREIRTEIIPRGMTRGEFDRWLDGKVPDFNLDLERRKTPEYMENLLKINSQAGYINAYGCRVPKPCQEIDDKGRDMDKICKLMHRGWEYSAKVLDTLNSFRVPDCLCTIYRLFNYEIGEGYRRLTCPNPMKEGEVFDTPWAVKKDCPLCQGTGSPSLVKSAEKK